MTATSEFLNRPIRTEEEVRAQDKPALCASGYPIGVGPCRKCGESADDTCPLVGTDDDLSGEDAPAMRCIHCHAFPQDCQCDGGIS